jgi:1-aminocyclopropane-1-carboxylate deaminase/D-cysteine desulfhydrase-like pyridoxal-dependent ACC family enzyme
MTIDHSASSLLLLLTAWTPRRYGLYPTPLHRLDRFSEAVGREVWIKRDDLISVGLGGNKVRKLGYLVADALALGADHLVSVGAEQSNHARCVAAVAALEGMDCHLVLGGDPKTPIVGNLLLDHMLGARLQFPGTHDWEQLERVSERLADQLRAEGKRPYVMPIGGSTPIGALGFVDAYLELREQMASVDVWPSAIVHATSSGGTQSGLVIGAHLLHDDVKVLGIGVAKTAGDLQA